MRLQQHASHRILAASVTPRSDGRHAFANSWQAIGHIGPRASIVGSILTPARAAQHRVALKLSDVPVRELLGTLHALVEPLAAAGGVSLGIDCERAPAVVRAERAALLWVLMNLAGNAVKLTPSGGCVSLSAIMLPNAVELRVAGTGTRIPPTQLDTIFEPFVQWHGTDEGQRRGVVPGLSSVRDLTRQMGGELLVRNAVGAGSHVAVRFQGAWDPAQRCARVPTAIAA
jgi:two-component system sensor histidine kinase BarA